MSDGLMVVGTAVVFGLLLWLQAYCYRRMSEGCKRWDAKHGARPGDRAERTVADDGVKPRPLPGESVEHFARRVLACWATGQCRTKEALTRAVAVGPRSWMLSACIEFKPQDLWLGAFWKRGEVIAGHRPFDLWICLLPCLPVHFWWYRKVNDGKPCCVDCGRRLTSDEAHYYENRCEVCEQELSAILEDA